MDTVQAHPLCKRVPDASVDTMQACQLCKRGRCIENHCESMADASKTISFVQIACQQALCGNARLIIRQILVTAKNSFLDLVRALNILIAAIEGTRTTGALANHKSRHNVFDKTLDGVTFIASRVSMDKIIALIREFD